jgi:hypothetical protein
MGAAFYFGERFTKPRKLRDDALLEIPKSGTGFRKKIMLKQKAGP